jgi:glycosyltransferase involved in cell wall biosynthesis
MTTVARLPISAFIIAHDEADRIGAAVDSVRGLCAEVIVLDSGSTDGTPEVAAAHGARVAHNPWRGYGPQKRAAEDLCAHDWTLNLDADERVTPRLAAEIRALFAAGRQAGADFWRLRIVDTFPHETRPAWWAFGHDQIRLYRRSVGRFSDSPVHDTVRPPAGAREGRLRGVMEHRSYRSLRFMVDKLNRYSDMQAANAKGRRVGALRLAVEFPLAFLKGYVVRRYALYGAFGITLATVYAFGRFLRLAKIQAAGRSAGE